jgi:hypothetical protein
MPVQKCPLCRETKEVVSSHLMPARMYEYCHPPGGHTISISSDLVIESDRQLQDYLLCRECEDSLNKGGETSLLPLLSQYRGPFPFYDLLTKFPPDAIDGDAAGYATARNPEIHSDKLIHFAMGVFWKAAVHSWSGTRTESMIDLGNYAEPIRIFLRGRTGFPKHMALTVGVLPPPAQLISFHNPYRGSINRWHNFLFYVSGIEFSLAVGKAVDNALRESCFASNPSHPIVVVDFSMDIVKVIKKVWANARKAKNVQKYFEKALRTKTGKT